MLRMKCYTKVFPSSALKAKAGISKDYKIECTSIIKKLYLRVATSWAIGNG